MHRIFRKIMGDGSIRYEVRSASLPYSRIDTPLPKWGPDLIQKNGGRMLVSKVKYKTISLVLAKAFKEGADREELSRVVLSYSQVL